MASLGLEQVVPRWKKAGTATCAPPGITTAEVMGPLQQEGKDWAKSLFTAPARVPTAGEQSTIIAKVMEVAIVAAMDNSCYLFHNEARQQTGGLYIGEDASRVLARLVMLDWTVELLKLAEMNHLQLFYHGHYVDDAEQVGRALPPGTRWQGGQMVLCPDLVEEDSAVPADVRTMREYVKMGSSINEDIELTGDAPSLHTSGKMPALDTQLWVEGGKVLYEHYRKPMANKLVMLQWSAMPAKVKGTTLTQEAIRILKSTSRALPWATAAGHLSELSARMYASGYDEQFRHEVLKAGVDGYEKMVKVEEEGGRSVNRPRSWREDRRQRDKYHKGLNWYRSGGHHVPLFVPHTPGSELARRMRQKEEKNSQGRNIRFLICEQGGERVLQNDHFSKKNIGEPPTQ